MTAKMVTTVSRGLQPTPNREKVYIIKDEEDSIRFVGLVEKEAFGEAEFLLFKYKSAFYVEVWSGPTLLDDITINGKCQAKTKSGAWCLNKSVMGSQFCRRHSVTG